MKGQDWKVALDLGSAKVAAVAARVDDRGRLEVVSLAYGASEGVERGVVTDPVLAGEAAARVLGKIERHLGTETGPVWMSVGGKGVLSDTGRAFAPISPPNRTVRPQDVHQLTEASRKLILPAGQETLMALPREFVVDGGRRTGDPLGMPASRLDVATHIVSASAAQLDALEAVGRVVQREVAGVVPSSLASGLGVLSQTAMDAGAVVVDIGAGKTDVSVFLDGAFAYQRVIPVGGALVSRDVAHLLKTTYEEAERLKVEHGAANPEAAEKGETVLVLQDGADHARPMQRRMLCEIIASRMREWSRLVAETLEDSGLEERPRLVFVTGGGSLLPGTEEILESLIANSTVKGTQPKVAGRFAGQVASPMLAVAAGLSRYALEAEDHELSPVARREGWRERIRTFLSHFDGKRSRRSGPGR